MYTLRLQGANGHVHFSGLLEHQEARMEVCGVSVGGANGTKGGESCHQKEGGGGISSNQSCFGGLFFSAQLELHPKPLREFFLIK